MLDIRSFRSRAPLIAFLLATSTASAASQFGSDSCSTPDVMPLGGPISFYNVNATTGAEGQGWSMCDFAPTTVIENDVWFLWTAPATGRAEFVSCTTNPDDPEPRLAVYPGTTCPGTIPVECTANQGCDGWSGGWISFEVEQGSKWLVQVGSVPGTSPGLGKISIHVTPNTNHLYRYDGTIAGASYAPITPNATGEFVWMNRFNAKGGADTLVRVEVAFGAPVPGWTPMVDGTPAKVAIWSDPDQDGDPADAQLLSSVPITVQNANTGIPVSVFLPQPVPVQGKFFVGAWVPVQAGQAPGVGGDASWDGWIHSHQAWTAFSASGPIDLACLGCLSTPPKHLWGMYGNVRVRALGGFEPEAYCFGDGSGTACPCGNPGAPGAGCANSSGAGALLASSGSTNVSSDDFTLLATQLPPSGGIGLAVAGSQQWHDGFTFQDGLLCVSGQLQRFPGQAYTSTIVQSSVVGASNGLITAGSTWNFQVWYRDTVGACGASSGNMTNGLQATFTP